MWGNISLGKVFDIPLQLHYTWFIIFVLVTFSLTIYPLVGPPYPPIERRIILGVLTSLLFFASIITHELAHSILAIRNNIPVKEITLFVFGGVFQITKEANHHRATRIATKVGQGIAYAIVAGGIAIILLPACCGLMACGSINWLVFRDAARASYPQVLLRDAPIGITARHVTDYANPLVPPHMNLTELVEQYILPTGRSCFLISWGA